VGISPRAVQDRHPSAQPTALAALQVSAPHRSRTSYSRRTRLSTAITAAVGPPSLQPAPSRARGVADEMPVRQRRQVCVGRREPAECGCSTPEAVTSTRWPLRTRCRRLDRATRVTALPTERQPAGRGRGLLVIVRTDTVERADRIVLGGPLAGGPVVLGGARQIGADCRIAVAIRASRRLELDHSCGSSCAQQRSSLTRTAAVSVACLLAARTASTRGLARAPTPANWPGRRLPRSWPRVTS
jgi:hypothetical protein